MLMDPLPVARTVQKYLQVYDQQVTIYDSKSVVSDHNNYASDMMRICLKIKTPEGGYRKITVIVKELLLDSIVTEAVQINVRFSTELKMYAEILPMMQQLIFECPLFGQETLWPYCLGQLDQSKLVLEDLKEAGYKIANCETGMDYDEASLAIKCLARFHALSVILVQRQLINPNDFSKFVFGGDFEEINELIVNSFKSLHQAISTTWSDEWKDIIDRLDKLSDVAVDQLKAIRCGNSRLKVLNHGDPWVNNMMFKYSNGFSKPESMKFVDFQLTHYDSFAFDLHYFLSTSVSYEVLFMSDRLILEYTETLGKCLRNMGNMDAPTFGEIINEMKRTEFFGLFAAVTVTPAICAPPELSPPKLNTTVMSLEEIDRRNTARYHTPEYTRRLQIMLRRAQHGGLLEQIFK